MKRLFLILGIVISIASCKSTSPVGTKLDMKSEVALKGDWILSHVSYPNSDYVKLKSFDLVDSNCFVGSRWNFVSNNNKGSFNLTNTACSLYSSAITWYVNKEGRFVMKILDAEKAKKVESGYVLDLINVTESTFQLIDHVVIAGKNTDVTYQFVRNN
ncbi:conserved hypothetical protein [Flavobacterium sp. 9AF]|uniref:lipocalin family protein n=1 Tax=Flavobacterium sp. 9AF TaxID=2653142 RepID=UPI0012EF272F|nr:lipocalin family protein [Flavobacterium sp. 9AF]VXB51884.1 conserved hypothetical protein [Flavobacterium sp. 9AF]